jgi:hypothetical protein
MAKKRNKPKKSSDGDKLSLNEGSVARDPFLSKDYLEDIDVHEDEEEADLVSRINARTGNRASFRSKHLDNDVMRISDTDTEDELPEAPRPEKKRKKKAKGKAVKESVSS